MSKELKEVKRKAKIEGEKIFMKLNKNLAMKDGSFPKVDQHNANTPYGKEATRTENQVVKTRVNIYKDKKKKERKEKVEDIYNNLKTRFTRRKQI